MDFGLFGSGSKRGLLGSDSGATIGWFHYLAFDMIIGTWVRRETAWARGLWGIALVPILALVFMFGPVGCLTYVVVWALFLRGKHLSALLYRRRTPAS